MTEHRGRRSRVTACAAQPRTAAANRSQREASGAARARDRGARPARPSPARRTARDTTTCRATPRWITPNFSGRPRALPRGEWRRTRATPWSRTRRRRRPAGASKARRRTNSSASGAPTRRSMPASSHSTEIGPSYPIVLSIRKHCSHGTSPWPVDTKSQPRRGSAHGRCEPSRPLRPLPIWRFASLQSTW